MIYTPTLGINIGSGVIRARRYAPIDNPDLRSRN